MVGIRPPAPLQPGRDAVERARTIGPKTERERALCRRRGAAVRPLRHHRSADAARRLPRSRWPGLRPRIRTTPRRRSSTRCRRRRGRVSCRSTRPTRSQLKAGAILETPDRDAAGSSGPGALHHPQLRRVRRSPTARSRRRGATRRSRRRRRTRCTCRRTPSRASATGRNRSTPTSRRRAVAKRDGVVGEELHAMDYQHLCLPADRAGRDGARGSSRRCRRSPRASIRRPPPARRRARAAFFAVAAIPARYALERGAWAEAASLEPRPSSYPYAEALTHTARARSAPRIPATRPSSKRVHRRVAANYATRSTHAEGGLLGRAGRDPAARARRRGWRSPKDDKHDAVAGLRTAAAIGGRDREGGGDAGPARAGARAARRDAAAAQAAAREALKEFETTLKKEPNRFRAVHGAAEGRDARRRPRDGPHILRSAR